MSSSTADPFDFPLVTRMVCPSYRRRSASVRRKRLCRHRARPSHTGRTPVQAWLMGAGQVTLK